MYTDVSPYIDDAGILPMPEECVVGLKARALVATTCNQTIGGMIDCERFSTLPKLLRVTVLVLEAIALFKKTQTHADLACTSVQLQWNTRRE